MRLVIGALMLVLILGGGGAVMASLGADEQPETAVPPVPAAVMTHPESTECATCHEPPSDNHFSSDCISCHTADGPWADVQVAHVTFGTHQTATQSCETCHTGKPATEIACRDCHGFRCGKDSKTAADCLECHRKALTESWVPAE